MPVLLVLRTYPREILTAMGARMAENVSYYIFTIVITTYVTTQLDLGKSFALNAVLIAAAIHFVTIPMWGALSDRIGRKPVYLFGAIGVGVWGFVFIALLNTKSFPLAVIGVIVGLLFHGAMYGPQSAFFSELFGTKVRYSGVSIGYQLASILAGGLAPIIAVKLLKSYGSGTPIAIYVAICAAISVVAVVSYRETKDRDLATVTKASPSELTGHRPPPRQFHGAGADLLRISAMPTDPSAALQLLRLLTAGASTAEIRAVEADPEARDLALRIRSAFDTRRRREAELTALVDTARDLAALRDPSVILEAIVRRARTLLGTDVAYLTLYDADAGDTFMRATDGSVSARFQSVRLSLGDGLGGLVASTHRPYWTADYFADQRFAHTGVIDTAVGDEGLVAICGTPLLVDAQFVGVLFAANRAPRPFFPGGGGAARVAGHARRGVDPADPSTARTAQALERLSEAHDAVHRHTAGIERAAAAHDRFAELVLAGGGLDDITAALAELTGGWVVLMDETGRRLSRTGPATGAAAGARGRPPQRGPLVHRHDMWAVTVKAAHEQLGFLVIGGVADLDDPDRRTIERAGMVTALLLLFERAATDAEQRMRTDLVSDLVGGAGTPPYGRRAPAARGSTSVIRTWSWSRAVTRRRPGGPW